MGIFYEMHVHSLGSVRYPDRENIPDRENSPVLGILSVFET